MMLQSLTLLFVLAAILFETWAKPVLKNLVCCFLIILVINNALMANISYFYMNLCYERTYSEGVEMMAEIHNLQDEHEFSKIAVIGSRLPEVQWEYFGPEIGEIAPAGKIYILSGMLETNLFVGAEHTIHFLKATYGLDLDKTEGAELRILSQSNEVQAMGCWPARDSIAVIGDTLVIKLAETTEVQ